MCVCKHRKLYIYIYIYIQTYMAATYIVFELATYVLPHTIYTQLCIPCFIPLWCQKCAHSFSNSKNSSFHLRVLFFERKRRQMLNVNVERMS